MRAATDWNWQDEARAEKKGRLICITLPHFGLREGESERESSSLSPAPCHFLSLSPSRTHTHTWRSSGKSANSRPITRREARETASSHDRRRLARVQSTDSAARRAPPRMGPAMACHRAALPRRQGERPSDSTKEVISHADNNKQFHSNSQIRLHALGVHELED